MSITRRDFIKVVGSTAALSLTGFPFIAQSAGKAKVIVVGGGYAGATAAKYLRLANPDIEVTLIEKGKEYVSCPLSNEVLCGERDIKSLTFTYDALVKNHGIKVIEGEVTEIDPAKKTVTVGGKAESADYIVVAPGVDFKWDAIEGYDEATAEKVPHAWKAGPQTLLLKKQVEGMKDGGTVIITAPPNPFRCPPGPYERAAQIAHYLKQKKPKSKVVILDAKDKFAKKDLFEAGWKQHYGEMISWVSKANGGEVKKFDAKKMTIVAGDMEDEHKGDVINIIPPQQAGKIAQKAGLADESGWCPVDPKTFESTLHKGVYVIGDASIAGAMPKSGYSANSQAKVCAAAIATAIAGGTPVEPSYVNTCYSLITPEHGISVAAVYQLKDGKIVGVEGAGGVSPKEATEKFVKLEAEYARSWFANVTADIFT